LAPLILVFLLAELILTRNLSGDETPKHDIFKIYDNIVHILQNEKKTEEKTNS